MQTKHIYNHQGFCTGCGTSKNVGLHINPDGTTFMIVEAKRWKDIVGSKGTS